MTINENTPPAGYVVVTKGKVRPSDLCWGSHTETWSHPTKLDWDTLGNDIKSYYSVARKA